MSRIRIRILGVWDFGRLSGWRLLARIGCASNGVFLEKDTDDGRDEDVEIGVCG
jgi:hypothetical protein